MRRRYRRWALSLLRCYPPAWRERYAEEMEATLDEHEITPMTLVDVLRGVFDAHLHPTLLSDGAAPSTYRMRNSEIAVFCAFVLFSIAWLPLQQIRDPLPVWDNAVRLHPEIRVAFVVSQIAGLVAFLAVIVGGLPLLGMVLVRAIRTQRRDVLIALAVPLLAIALLTVYALLASAAWTQRQQPTPNAPFTLLAVLLQLGLIVLLGLAVVASTAAIAVAIARGEPDTRALRFALIPAAITTAAMGAGALATLVLAALAAMEAPELGALGSVPVTLMMATATVLATVALRRGIYRRIA